jgi:WD40 repeat protein
MRRLDGHKKGVRALAFSPDGTRLAAVAGREKRASVWTLADGSRTKSPGTPDYVRTFTFTPDGSALVVAVGRYLRRWTFASGSVEEKWLRAANDVWHVAYAPDGSSVAAVTFPFHDGADRFRVDLFPTAAPGPKSFLVGGYGSPYAAAYSEDGRFFAAGGWMNVINVWRRSGGARATSWTCVGKAHAVAFTPDGSLAVVASGEVLTVFDTTTHKPVRSLDGHAGPVRSLASCPDGSVVSGGDDGTVCSWDPASGRRLQRFDWQVGPVKSVACTPDGLLAAAGGDTGLVVWDVQ